MAKVISPLMSMEASGKLGNALVYLRIGGDNIVRQYTIPANPQTTQQMLHRSVFGAAAKGAKAIVDPATIAIVQAVANEPFRWRQAVIKYTVGSWDDALSEYNQFDPGDQDDWNNAAIGLGIQPYTLGLNTYTPGQIFFATAVGLNSFLHQTPPSGTDSAVWVGHFS